MITCPYQIKHVQDFIKLMSNLAEKAEDKFGVKAIALVAQSACETLWGRQITWVFDANGNKVTTNNYFNIKDMKGDNWNGPSGYRTVPEIIDGKEVQVPNQYFRIYSGLEESIADYIKLISTVARYTTAWSVRNDDQKYLVEVAKAGFATGIEYAQVCCSIARNLKRV